MKLQYKLALQFFSFGTMILLILAWRYDAHNHQVLTDEALDTVETLAKESAQHINTYLKAKATVAQTLASAPIIREALLQSNREYAPLPAEKRAEKINLLNQKWTQTKDNSAPFIQQHMTTPAAEYFKKQQSSFSGTYGEIFLTNRYGVMIATTNKLTTLAHAHKYWWVASYNKGQGRIFFDDRGFDSSVQGYVLGIVVPVMEQGEILGILKCNVNIIGPLSHIVQNFNIDHASTLKIVRSGGTIVFEEGRVPLTSQLSEPLIQNLKTNKTGTSIVDVSGVELLSAYTPIQITSGSSMYGFGGSYESIDHVVGNRGEGWDVVLQLDKEIIYQKAHQTTGMLISLGILLIIAMAASALFLGRKIAQPLRKLAQSAEYIGKGHLDTQIDISSEDEIGILGMAFNSMVKNLRNTMTSRDELALEIQHRKEMEGRVHIFRELLEHSTDAIFLIDTSTSQFLDLNSKACANLGYSRSELLTMGVVDIEAKIPDNFSWFDHMKIVREQKTMFLEGCHKRKDGTTFPVEVGVKVTTHEGKEYMISIARDITARKKTEEEKEQLIAELQEALGKVKILSGFLPICASCKKIRDDKGYWNQIEDYIKKHSEAEFSHGICPDCAKKLYPELDIHDTQK